MQHKTHINTLPMVPFSIYLLNSDMEVCPKRIYTVVKTRVSKSGTLEIYVQEFKKFLDYDPQHMPVVVQFFVN